MAANTIMKKAILVGLGVAATSSTHAERYVMPSNTDCQTISIPISSSFTTSTKWYRDASRYSLEQLKSNKRKLESISKLQPNWNNFGAEGFDELVISKILHIISDLEYQPQIFPTGRGSIQIEKYFDEYNFIEIEVSKNEIFAYQVKNGQEIEKEISVDEISILFSELYA